MSAWKPAVVRSWLARRVVRALPRRPTSSVGTSQTRELVDEDETSARLEDSCALAQAGWLIGPVVEGGRTHDQVEGAVGVGQLFGDTDGEAEAIVVGGRGGDFDH